jgi:hypothetical protein
MVPAGTYRRRLQSLDEVVNASRSSSSSSFSDVAAAVTAANATLVPEPDAYRTVFDLDDQRRVIRQLGHYFEDDWTRKAWTTKFVGSSNNFADGVTVCEVDEDCELGSAICRGSTPFQKNGALGCSSCPLRNFFFANAKPDTPALRRGARAPFRTRRRQA